MCGPESSFLQKRPYLGPLCSDQHVIRPGILRPPAQSAASGYTYPLSFEARMPIEVAFGIEYRTYRNCNGYMKIGMEHANFSPRKHPS